MTITLKRLAELCIQVEQTQARTRDQSPPEIPLFMEGRYNSDRVEVLALAEVQEHKLFARVIDYVEKYGGSLILINCHDVRALLKDAELTPELLLEEFPPPGAYH